jgi:hypothetical protein
MGRVFHLKDLGRDQFCQDQIVDEDDFKVYCLTKILEGYQMFCPYSRDDLCPCGFKNEIAPQRNPQPGADGVCRDYVSVKDGDVSLFNPPTEEEKKRIMEGMAQDA